MTQPKVALITGAARRVGATIAQALHAEGYNLLLHYNHSDTEAHNLAASFNQQRSESAAILQADLNEMSSVEQLAEHAIAKWGRIDLLVNNASSFYPTPVSDSTQEQWDDLVNSNLRAPYFLSAALSKTLQKSQGCIINMIDIHAQRALPNHPIYSIAKAGLQMMTYSLAKELAPKVRVNGIAPGAILWPEPEPSDAEKEAILDKTLLQRTGNADDLAQAVIYLSKAGFVTGQVIAIDGGKSLFSH